MWLTCVCLVLLATCASLHVRDKLHQDSLIRLLLNRKAYRLGKWLADLNKVRRLSLDNKRNIIEAGACLGEGVYYFAEQFTW